MPDVVIAVLNYNGRRWLDACLDSLTRQTVPARLVVIDNASSDGSAAHVRARWPNVQVLAFERNLGFAEGYNRALAGLQAEWAALVNNDAALAPDWLEVLLSAAAERPQAAILGGKLHFAGQETVDRLLQCVGTRVTDAGTAFEVGWGEADRGQYDRPGPTASVPGAALLIRKAVFDELGGFDRDYFAYLEDVDLCWRAWLAGHEVWCFPAAEATHHFGGSAGGRASPFRIRLMQRNRLANMLKLLEPGTLAAGLLTSTAYDLYRVLEFSAHGHWAGLAALAAGSLDFWRSLPGLLGARRRIQQSRRRADRELRARGLLVSARAAFREYRRLAVLARSRAP